jgi:hypothetical protein
LFKELFGRLLEGNSQKNSVQNDKQAAIIIKLLEIRNDLAYDVCFTETLIDQRNV